jgi:hypothetical protein
MSLYRSVRLRVSRLFLSLCLPLSGSPGHAAPRPSNYAYNLEFSTYLGGSGHDLIRGMDVDAEGNIYVVGVAGSADFPRTPGSLAGQTKENGSLVAKFSPKGKLIWSKVIGGGNGYLYSVKVDRKGYIFVAGRAGPGFPTTPGAFQPTTAHICGFAGKLKPEGSGWVWATYVGTGYAVRDMTMDDKGDIYGILDYFAESTDTLPAAWFVHAFHQTPHGGGQHFGRSDAGVIKISSEGKVIWATWIGGSKGNDWVGSLGVGSDHAPVIFLNTYSMDMPVTSAAFCKTPSAGGWLGKVSADGSGLIFGTYTCGAPIGPRTHNVAVDSEGNAFIGFCTPSLSAVTRGAFQTKFGGGPQDYGIEKISPTGALLAATFIGGNGDEINGPDQVLVDKHGNVMIVGSSSSTDYPVTTGAFQKQNKGYFDGVVSLLSNDLSKLLYSSYMGGDSDDFIRASCFGRDGTLYLGGVTGSSNWPTKNAYQTKYAGPPGLQNMSKDWGNGDGVVVKFSVR